MIDQRLWIFASRRHNANRSNCVLPTSHTSSDCSLEDVAGASYKLQNSIAEATRVQQQDALTAVLVSFNGGTKLLGRLLADARHFLNPIGFNRCLQIIETTYAERLMQR